MSSVLQTFVELINEDYINSSFISSRASSLKTFPITPSCPPSVCVSELPPLLIEHTCLWICFRYSLVLFSICVKYPCHVSPMLEVALWGQSPRSILLYPKYGHVFYDTYIHWTLWRDGYCSDNVDNSKFLLLLSYFTSSHVGIEHKVLWLETRHVNY